MPRRSHAAVHTLPRVAGRHRLLLALLLAVLTVPFAPAPPAEAIDPWQQTLEITFPTDPRAGFSDTYTACRSGCARTHQAADLMGQKMWPLYAAVDGRICSINDEAQEDSYGRNITVCGNDGVTRFRYLHLNNDTPGTDDGAAALEHVYAPNIRRGSRVVAGQLIAYMGDSGNAENTSPHLHFDVYVDGVVNPYGEERINPYHSLVAALAAGRVSDGSVVPREPTTRLAGDSRVTTAIEVSKDAFDQAEVVLLASSAVPHDALVAGPLASVLGGPVLLTDPYELDARSLAEVERLGASTVIIVGDAARMAGRLSALVPGLDVQTVGSEDRFQTSAAVAELVWAATGAASPDESELPEVPQTPVAPGLDHLSSDEIQALLDGHEPTLLLQTGRDRNSPTAVLDGATFSADDLTTKRLRSWLVGVDPDDVNRVDFVFDGEDENTEYEWPYDLGGTNGRYSGVSMPRPGEHVLEATVRFRNGARQTVTATFTILPGDGDSGGDWGGGSSEPDPARRRAIVAKGEDPDPRRSWPDALAASWYGAARELPVLLTSSTGLPSQTAAALEGVTEVIVAGGPGAISDEQVAQIESATGVAARRLAGPDRYLTAAAIAQELVGRGLARTSTVHVATGENWPDAVTAASAVASRRGTLLLVDPGGAAPSVRQTFQALADDIDDIVALGGPNAVTAAALDNVAAWAV